MATVNLILAALGVYIVIGLAFAAAFVTLLIGRIDPAARGAGPVFRVLILPGVALLWPLMAFKALRPKGHDA